MTELHFCQLEVQGDIPEIWKLTVSDGELDKGIVFEYRWLGLNGARGILSHMGDYLDRLV